MGIVRVIGYRSQRTLAAPAEMPGVGFITGARVRVRLLPAPADAGIVFRRIDLPGSPAVPAHISHVSNTDRRTSIGPAATGITLTEHLLAALAGLRIDNCTIELDCVEPPGLDGSAGDFVKLLWRTGAAPQSGRRPIFATDRPITASNGDATLALHPADGPGLRATYILDYGLHSSIPRQMYTLDVTPENFAVEVARCRTFSTEAEARALQAQGVAKHLSPTDVVVFGPRGPDPQPPPLRGRAGPPQGPRYARRSRPVRLRPRRAPGRLPLRALAQRATGPTTDRGNTN